MLRIKILALAFFAAWTMAPPSGFAEEITKVVTAPYDYTQVCYKITWPPGTECVDRFLPAASGLLEVGGVKVIEVPGQAPLMPANISRMGAGTLFYAGSPGTLTATARLSAIQPGNLLTDKTVVCLSVAFESSCSDTLTVEEITVTGRVLTADVLVEAYLLRTYTGLSALLLHDLTLHFTPDSDIDETP